MLALLIVLIVTNLVMLGVLAWCVLRPVDQPRADVHVARALPADRIGTRRVITIEVRNPIELAGRRNRWAGIAGSLAPGLTHRLVHDKVVKSLRRELAEQGVVADVRLQTIETAAPVEVVTPEDVQSR